MSRILVCWRGYKRNMLAFGLVVDEYTRRARLSYTPARTSSIGDKCREYVYSTLPDFVVIIEHAMMYRYATLHYCSQRIPQHVCEELVKLIDRMLLTNKGVDEIIIAVEDKSRELLTREYFHY